ncbi:hypothetical protein K438DRAFT_1941402 [Mycena galopus ATCC 62051]|nr:hypothetical protein K438DRAFT_1941402 [Mycena galopus ATCC 62051]
MSRYWPVPALQAAGVHPPPLPLARHYLPSPGTLPDHPGMFVQYWHKFDAADIAWLVTGCHTDGRHNPATNQFFPEFHELRDSLPTGDLGSTVRKALRTKFLDLLFDCGGSTVIFHAQGTTIPDTPLVPEYLRASAYLPRALVDRDTTTHGPIAQMAQLFIEAVAVPTVAAWADNAHHLGWPLDQQFNVVPRVNPASHVLVPGPIARNSTLYVFRGRPSGALDALLGIPAPLVVTIPDDDDDYEAALTTLAQRDQQITDLESE